MLLATVVLSLLNNVSFVISTFSKTETLTINQPYICNECHSASLRAQSLADFKIVTIKKGTCRVVSNISYNEITSLLETSELNKKKLVICEK